MYLSIYHVFRNPKVNLKLKSFCILSWKLLKLCDIRMSRQYSTSILFNDYRQDRSRITLRCFNYKYSLVQMVFKGLALNKIEIFSNLDKVLN